MTNAAYVLYRLDSFQSHKIRIYQNAKGESDVEIMPCTDIQRTHSPSKSVLKYRLILLGLKP